MKANAARGLVTFIASDNVLNQLGKLLHSYLGK
jgi:hypothetical protein